MPFGFTEALKQWSVSASERAVGLMVDAGGRGMAQRIGGQLGASLSPPANGVWDEEGNFDFGIQFDVDGAFDDATFAL